jgi:hypothetical protein
VGAVLPPEYAVAPARDWGGVASTTTEGSGVAATEVRSLPAFSALDMAGTSNVSVRVGGKQAVVVRADDNLIKQVTTEVRGGELVVSNTGSFKAQTPMTVAVTVPRLEGATLSGSGIVSVEGAEGQDFAVRVPGSGVLTAAGTVDRLDASLGGTGDVRLQGLAAREVTATVSGDGRLQVRASRTLDASVSGTGAIFYSGTPSTVTKRVTGTGAILGG